MQEHLPRHRKHPRKSSLKALLAIGILFSAGSLLGGCKPKPDTLTDEYGNPISEPTVTSAEAPAVSEPRPIITPPPPPPPGALPKVGGPSTDENVRPLSPEQLRRLADALPEGQALLPTYSVGLGLTDAEEAYMVASEAETEGLGELSLAIASPLGDRIPLPTDPATASWQFYDLQALSYQDWNSDGKGPDILALTSYVTGIGPNGAEPFTVATVYTYQGSYGYQIDQTTSNLLNDQNTTTVAAAKAMLLGETETSASE